MFEDITERILPLGPEKIILFGSQAKGTAGENSDIDLCVVMETSSKRRCAAEIQMLLDYEIPLDIIVYTPSEWKECIEDAGSFATKIFNEGIVLYG